MAVEIERKFLVTNDSWFFDEFESITEIEQVYLSFDPAVRIRINDRLEQAKMCCKTQTNDPRVRHEVEFEIDYDNARKVVDAFDCKNTIFKERFVIDVGGKKWEIDKFLGANAGLVVAEIELQSKEEDVDLPSWVGDEVTDDPKYLNVNLAQNPYNEWGKTS